MAKVEQLTVQVQVRFQYGLNRIYPINQLAKDFVTLTGRKTFLAPDLAVIEKLGFKIEWIPSSLDITR